MSSLKPLAAQSPLSGYSATFDQTRVSEADNLMMLSIAVPKKGLQAVNAALTDMCGLIFPETGQCLVSDNATLDSSENAFTLLGLQKEQCLLVTQCKGQSTHTLYQEIKKRLQSVAYVTDQSDNYAVLDIDGPDALSSLERICPLDMASFDASMTSRTLMEHLQVIVQKPGIDHVRLFSPRSSAKSFLHAVTTSLFNVTPANTMTDTSPGRTTHQEESS